MCPLSTHHPAYIHPCSPFFDARVLRTRSDDSLRCHHARHHHGTRRTSCMSSEFCYVRGDSAQSERARSGHRDWCIYIAVVVFDLRHAFTRGLLRATCTGRRHARSCGPYSAGGRYLSASPTSIHASSHAPRVWRSTGRARVCCPTSTWTSQARSP